MKSIKILVVMISLFSLTGIGYSIDGEEIIKKVKDKYDTIETLSANFIQTFKWKLADEVQQQEGTILLKNQDKFRIETADQVVVSNGKTLWTFSKTNNQVIIDNIKNTEETILPKEIFLKFSKQYKPILVGEEKIDEKECYVVRLVAKSEDVFIKETQVFVDKESWMTIQIENTDVNDNITSYKLFKIQVDELLKESDFNLKMPENVEVIDMR